MEYVQIANEFFSLRVNYRGAEISSLYSNTLKTDIIWNADPKVWNRHAPILFPIVGSLKNSVYRYKHGQYSLSQHGFARDMVFKLKELTDDQIVFVLDSDQSTLVNYPFEFSLEVKYKLINNYLRIYYRVINPSSKKLYFSIGAHPGFKLPYHSGLNFSDYHLEFESSESLDKYLISPNGLLSGEKESFLHNSKSINLEYNLFDQSALVFKKHKSKFVDLRSDKAPSYIRVGIQDFPFLGIWTKPKTNGNFLCIEPWYGIADSESHSGVLEEKEGMLELDANEEFECSYYIAVF